MCAVVARMNRLLCLMLEQDPSTCHLDLVTLRFCFLEECFHHCVYHFVCLSSHIS
ncbi:hypothetical protein Plhal304r1_c068g0156441 [Plasmopara halstedii]